MTIAGRFDRSQIDPALRDHSAWPSVSKDLLSEHDRERFERRYSAVVDYLSGSRLREIREKYGVGTPELYRFVSRCLEINPTDGRIWGFRALIPNKRVTRYSRVAAVGSAAGPCGKSGAFDQFLRMNPDLREAVDALYLRRGGRRYAHESRIPVTKIHRKLMELAMKKGLRTDQYPFTSQSKGLVALTRYLHSLKERDIAAAVAARDGEVASRLLSRSDAHGLPKAGPIKPYQQVQFDGHRLDAFFTVEMPNPDGSLRIETVNRPWLLVIMDVASRAIIGYHLCLKEKYSAWDIVQTVKRALVPWRPAALTIPGLQYVDGAGLPSGVIPGLQWATWDEFSYDNDKANISRLVISLLSQELGCAVNPGPVASPETRALLERLFQTLEEEGFHRLPTTTGTGPGDPRRRSPETTAVACGITSEHISQLLDVIVADYNARPHSSLGYQSPLERLQMDLDHGRAMARILPEEQRDPWCFLTYKVDRRVCGSLARGQRPYVNFMDARYQNEVLARMPGLIGKIVRLAVNVDDLRCVKAFLSDGSELGVLTAVGGWSRTPHAIDTRQTINQLRAQKKISIPEGSDPVQVLLSYLAERGRAEKNARGRYHQVARLSGQANPSQLPEADNRAMSVSRSKDPEPPSGKMGDRVVKAVVY